MARQFAEIFDGFGDRLEVKDIEELFGVSEQTVRRWLAKGELPAYRTPGAGWLILTAEVRDWMVTRSNQQQ